MLSFKKYSQDFFQKKHYNMNMNFEQIQSNLIFLSNLKFFNFFKNILSELNQIEKRFSLKKI